MNIYTFKLTKKTFGIIAAAVLLIVGLIIALCSCGRGDATETSGKLSEQDELMQFITSLGYAPDNEKHSMREVVVPSNFDEVYTKYNELQKQNGYDLEKYKGKKVCLHTFPLKDYDGAQDVLCDLLVYKGKVIGGSIYTADVSGFMHGLCKKQQ